MAAPLPPQPPKAPGTPPSAPASREEKIVVIPESFYGVALHMQPPFPTDEDPGGMPKPPAPPVAPPPPPHTVRYGAPRVVAPTPVMPAPAHQSRLWLVALVVVLLLAIGGGWVAWNRDLLFGTTPSSPLVVLPPAAPNAPESVEVVSTAPGVARLTWNDRSETEAGFRVERKTAFDAEFVPLHTLPANSLTFLDPTAPADATVSYRVVAFNEGGESPSEPREVRVQATPVTPSQPTLPPDGLDSDADGLTDTEEGLYGTAANLPDSDGDGYLDGNEVFNLYDPSMPAPATMLLSARTETVSSTIGWQMLAPRSWTVEEEASGEIRLRVPTGEVLRVFAEPVALRGDLTTWLSTNKQWSANQLVEMSSNKYRLPFVLGPDRLQAFFAWNDRVLSVKYELGSQAFVNYRMSFGMLLNSLRFEGAPLLPDLSTSVEVPEDFQRGASVSASSTEPIVSETATTSSQALPPLTAVTSSQP